MRKTVDPLTTTLLAALGLVWLVLLVAPPAVLLVARQRWLTSVEGAESQMQWDRFRAAMREQAGPQGPVQHKVPKSPEPPLRVWLRDYVWLAVAAWLVLGGTLGLATGLLVVGAVAGRRRDGRRLPSEDQPGRERDHEEQHERDAENAEKR